MATMALWFELDDESAARFSEAIRVASTKFGTPVFTPHITLFAGLWIDEVTALALMNDLVADSSGVNVQFGDIGYDETWSRSVFARALPSNEMVEMHQRAGKVLGLAGPTYAPHLSLMYGEFPREEKIEAIEQLELELPRTAMVSAVSLWHTDPTSVSLWRCLRRVPVPGTASPMSPLSAAAKQLF